MTADLAAALLNRAANGNELLQILDRLEAGAIAANIQDCADHYAAISDPDQF